MIRNFLFDIGNVLLLFDFEPVLDRLNHRTDLTRQEAMGILLHHRDLMEAGAITASQFLDRIISDLAFPGSPEKARALYADIFTENPPTWDLAAHLLATGHRLALFSNISPIHADFLETRFPRIRMFPDAVFSFRTGDIKPRPGMYLHASGVLGMDPRETLLIDDKAENIAAGQAHGFRTHHYDAARHDELLAALQDAGVPLPG